ncbi:MAG: T9SS type A sorting domain-containing protein [Bacteroidales bacterium]|nr:T9SS type A sorting domain-containing protein [Bacteroidales bacterium]
MTNLFFLIIIFLFSLFPTNSQDTITILTYNLLNFDNVTPYCNNNNNSTQKKIIALRQLLNYIKPDIIGFNEIKATSATIDLILTDVLSYVQGKTYNRIPFYNSSSADIVSTLFYNNKKFTLTQSNSIPTNVRDIIITKLYYNSPDVSNLYDTVYIQPIVMHLKAGSTQSDQTERAKQTLALMNYLSTLPDKRNLIIMGDFNVQSSTEECFQNLINYSNPIIRFYDPPNKLGNWNNNQNFAKYHTQSVYLTSNGCNASGGLDDRFDFIMTSYHIINNLNKVSYLQNSYRVIGQDGNHFDCDLKTPPNNSEPPYIIDALYDISDHLPVIMKIVIHQTPYIAIQEIFNSSLIKVATENNTLHIFINTHLKDKKLKISIIDCLGKVISNTEQNYNNIIKIPFNYNSGMYLIKIESNSFCYITKFLKT